MGGDGAERPCVYERRAGAASSPLAPVYRPRNPEASLLHRAVREGLEEALGDTSAPGGWPPFVREAFEAYLRCGVLREGFSRVRCGGCGDELLVGFSCKERGACPSCASRRAHDVATWLCDRVLPPAPYRQWTVSFPIRLRFALAKDAALCAAVLDCFARTLFGHLRRRGRDLGTANGAPGAVTFVQRFGSALQLNVHFHLLSPDGLFTPEGAFVPLPPPDDEDVRVLLERFLHRLKALLERWDLEALEGLPEDALTALWWESAHARPPSAERAAPPRRKRRCAEAEGFSLHAGTHVHENDRAGLYTLCQYGARGPLSLERLEAREDGLYAYRMKRPAPNGATHLLLTAAQLCRRLCALIPPQKTHLTRFHGVFAPNARLRHKVVPAPPPSRCVPPIAPDETTSTSPAAGPPSPEAPPRFLRRVPWAELLRRSFGLDVLRCHACGMRRTVLAFITHLPTARRILLHLQLPCGPPPLPASPRHPQLTFVPVDGA